MTCIEYKEYKQRFQVLSSIGKGNYASVLKISDVKTKKHFALKYTKFASADKLCVAFQQIEVIRAINHPLAIQIIYYFTKMIKTQKIISNEIEFGVIMELGDRSLSQDIFMRKRKCKYYSQYEIEDLSFALINFFAQMQIKGYMHRDIKPENILILTPVGTVLPAINTFRVCDFGFSIKSHDFSDQNIAGTASYASPKIRNKFEHSELFIKGNNYRDDAYSLGITLIETCMLQTVEGKMPKKFLPEISNRYGAKFASLIQSMIEFEQSKRLDFLELNKYFENNIKQKQIQSLPINIPVNLRNASLTTPIKNKITKEKSKFNKLQDMESTATDSQLFQNNYKYSFVQQVPSQMQQHPTNKKQCFIKNDQNLKNTQKKNQFCAKQTDYQNQRLIYTIKQQKPSFKGTSKQQNNSLVNCITKTTKLSQSSDLFIPTTSIEKCIDDKIKTKRRSKLITTGNPVIPNKFQDFSYKQIIKETQNNLNHYKKMNQNFNREQTTSLPKTAIAQGTTNLFKFQQGSQIQFLTVANIFDQENVEDKLIVIAIANGRFFICSHSFGQENLIIEIKFNKTLNNIKFIKYCSKIGRLIIVCDNEIIHTLSTQNLTSTLNEFIQNNNYLVTSTELGFIELNTNTSDIIALSISQATGDVLKGFKNGDIYQNNKLVTSGIKRSQVDFLVKWGRFMFVGSRDGTITKHSYKQSSSIYGSSNLLGYFDCKCTVVGIELADLGKQTLLLVLLFNGFTLYFNQNLEIVKSKQISKACICAAKIDFSLQEGRRVLVVNSLGQVVNEHGAILAETKLKDCENLFDLGMNNKIIVVAQSKSIFEVKLPNNNEPKQKMQIPLLRNENPQLKIQENLKDSILNKKAYKQFYAKPSKPKIHKANAVFY